MKLKNKKVENRVQLLQEMNLVNPLMHRVLKMKNKKMTPSRLIMIMIQPREVRLDLILFH